MKTKKNFTLTPRTRNGERLSLRLSAVDMHKIRHGGDWQATVTDLDTGKIYRVRGASCGSPCHCDAIAVEVRKGTAR